jgi:DnaJ-class molecular chaperone
MNPYREPSKGEPCHKCDGTGRVYEWYGLGGGYEDCERCNGAGTTQETPTPTGSGAP